MEHLKEPQMVAYITPAVAHYGALYIIISQYYVLKSLDLILFLPCLFICAAQFFEIVRADVYGSGLFLLSTAARCATI